ncbi:hypothetical protein ACWDHW_34695 [Streptomyces melanosporofaciens]|uniref:hypothetical protein n=1 Tax=unclassified Streptomyces TaxID=2593676 RepID=UPI0036C90E6D
METGLSNSFTGSAPTKQIDPAEKTEPWPGTCDSVMSARTNGFFGPPTSLQVSVQHSIAG